MEDGERKYIVVEAIITIASARSKGSNEVTKPLSTKRRGTLASVEKSYEVEKIPPIETKDLMKHIYRSSQHIETTVQKNQSQYSVQLQLPSRAILIIVFISRAVVAYH